MDNDDEAVAEAFEARGVVDFGTAMAIVPSASQLLFSFCEEWG